MTIAPEQAGFTDGDFADAGELMGGRLVEPAVGVAEWRCLNTAGPLGSRFYSGTGLRDDDGLRGLIGHEFTGNPVGRPGLEVLQKSVRLTATGSSAPTSTAATIPGPKGNLVFNASTMWWPQFLNVGTRLPFPGDGAPRFTAPPAGLLSGVRRTCRGSSA